MNFDEINKLKEGEVLDCHVCGKKLVHGKDEIHFIGEPSFIFDELADSFEDDLLPMCEKCHDKIFGKDPD